MNPENMKLFQTAANELANPTATRIGKGLGGLVSAITYWPEKLGIYTEAKREAYSREVNAELSKIPDENKDASLLGNTMKVIEDSKYSLNDDLLREMFAKLIASTVDNRVNSEFSPRYSAILSQLSGKNALFLQKLVENGHYKIPAFYYMKQNDTLGTANIGELQISPTSDIGNTFEDDVSLGILESFKIIDIPYDGFLTSDVDQKFYSDAESTPSAILIKPLVKQPYEFAINKKFVEITKFGKALSNIVCNSNFD